MRKIITILALVLTVALCTSFAVSAVDPVTISGLNTATQDANVTVNPKAEDKSAVYSVDVTWTDVAFTYNAGTTTWNPSTHKYDAAGTAASWTDNQGTVTVTNHSNAAVTATVSFEPSGDVNVAIENAEIELPSAEGKATTATELIGTATLTASGAPTATGKIGTVKVTIAAGN